MSELRLFEMQLKPLDREYFCSTFVLMMYGHSLSANLPEDFGLGDRFWYWRGASGQSYIHSIYSRELCPPVAGAIFVLVRNTRGTRQALFTGRLCGDGKLPHRLAHVTGQDVEVHVHLLARDADTAGTVLRDLEATIEGATMPLPEARAYRKPVQLELLAA